MFLRVATDWYEVFTESKDYGDKPKSDLKDILTMYYKSFKPLRDKKAYDRNKKAYDRAKAKFREELEELLDLYLRGEITDGQFSYRSKKRFKAIYDKAFRLGMKSTGLDYVEPDTSDNKWLKKFRYTEYKYLNKFVDDVKNGRGTMDYRKRMDMYVNTVDSMFDAGRVDAFPNDGTKVSWVLSAVEHCPDCLYLARKSPYKPNELPTTPRAGATQCLSNCKCSLRISYSHPESEIKFRKVDAVPLNEGINWNDVDTMMTDWLTVEHKGKINNKLALEEKLERVTRFEQLAKTLPENIDPFEVEFEILHRIGDMVIKSR